MGLQGNAVPLRAKRRFAGFGHKSIARYPYGQVVRFAILRGRFMWKSSCFSLLLHNKKPP